MAHQQTLRRPTQYLEIDEAHTLVNVYIHSGSKERDRIDINTPRNSNSFAKTLLNAFLPAGYPHSVTKDYLEYQIYDSLQAFSSSIAGLLSSRAVLEGIGVGDSHASPTVALLLRVLQDSMGRIATILFAHRLGTSLEPECKMYRLAADIFNDAAMILDCLSPAFPKATRVFLLSLSSILRSLCGVAAGSSKASLSAHFATQGNLGELNAKDSSQETVISLLGLLAGSLVVSYISSQWATWIAMIALLTIHLGTNYFAVRAVSMRTLNRQRANLLFSAYLESYNTTREDESTNRFLTPEEISIRERIFERDGVLRWQGGQILGYCEIGVSLRRILDSFSKPDSTTGSYTGTGFSNAQKLLDEFGMEDYILWYDQTRKTFLIVLKSTASVTTQLHAWMHALTLAKKIDEGLEDKSILEAIIKTHTALRAIALKTFDVQLLEAGWDIETGALETRSGTRIKEDCFDNTT